MKNFTLFIFLIGSIFLNSKTFASTVCLNMIVKNEKDVIVRCLSSVKPLIDYWVIVDTGSTDGTQQIIREFMKDIPGELHERPWKNFAHNRTEAINLAKGKADYVLIIDADDTLEFPRGFRFPHLDKDIYYILFEDWGTRYYRTQLVKSSLNWRWISVLHEYLDCPEARSAANLDGITYKRGSGGARSKDPQKFLRDIEVLEAALKEEPNNDRYVFYLAQSYKDYHNFEKAIEVYRRRIAMGGWDQEVFWSLLQIARLQQLLKMPKKVITESYYKAYLYRPIRAEPLYYLSNYYREAGNFQDAYYIAKEGLAHPIPNDRLFVEQWVYDWGMLLEYSVSAYWIGHYEEAKNASYQILAKKPLPQSVRECVEKNLYWINTKLEEEKIKKLKF